MIPVSPRAAAYKVDSAESIEDAPKLLQMARKLLAGNYSLVSFKDLSEGSRAVANLTVENLTLNDLDFYAIVRNDALHGADIGYKLILSKEDGARMMDIIEGAIADVMAAINKNNYMPFNDSRIVTIVKL